MEKIVVSIQPEEEWFIGTPFFGKEVSSYKELTSLIKKLVNRYDNGTIVKKFNFKLNFFTVETISAIKKSGDSQCKRKGYVNPFLLKSIYKMDKYSEITIHCDRNGWYNEDPKRVFHYVIERSNKNMLPVYGNLSNVLKVLNIL